MSDSSCGVSSCGSNVSGINESYIMAGSSGSCSFIKQERIENVVYVRELTFCLKVVPLKSPNKSFYRFLLRIFVMVWMLNQLMIKHKFSSI